VLRGGDGADRVYGGRGGSRGNVDELYGAAGADELYGGPGDEVIHGGADNDLLVADPTPPVHRRCHSQLFGEGGDDTLNAVNDAPTDTLDGGAGTDACNGDPGDTIAGCP
jgi:Ca2+-binding RTX toxin-like protein